MRKAFKVCLFSLTTFSFILVPLYTSEGQALPMCSILEEEKDLAKEKESIDFELESYVVGVVAGEMPYNFPNEALKAQAVAARTYAYREKLANPSTSYYSIKQAFISVEKMKSMWGKNFKENYEKVKNAVFDTAGEIMVYENEPILATFCSTTNGYTEDCENVWVQKLPYLKSVKSEGEENSPYFYEKKEISKKRFLEIFGDLNFKILEKTEAGYVKKIEVNKKTYTGNEFRQIFSLRSNDFKISKSKDYIIIETKGYGHAVGMSQYGACFMAKNGKSYKEILTHYYSGVNITKYWKKWKNFYLWL